MSGLIGPAFAIWLLLPLGSAQEPNAITRETTVTVTVDRVDPSTRLVMFHGAEGVAQSVYVDRAVTGLDDLKPGDMVTVRYIESVVVQVRPDTSPMGFRDTTGDARKSGEQGVVQQLTAVVTVESVDPQALTVTYRTHDNRRVMRAVRDKRLLEGVKAGDRVEITQTQARAVSITRGGR